MLPQALSNGICSLNQGEDRLALSCIMTLDAHGNVVDHTIAETVVCIDRRMSYTSVKKILEDRDPVEMAEYHQWVPAFELMAEVSGLIRKKRQKRGSIDFDFSETKIYLDENGHVSRIAPYERNVATRMIEDFMLLANETVAEHFYWQETPFLYRTHEEPDMDKIRKLSAFIGNFGYTIKGSGKKGEIHPKELQKLLGKIQGTPEEALILRLTLRSMQQARYTTVCSGHFGLAADYYCHFTSPIRRYPDLQIHRIIKENLRGRFDEARREHYTALLPQVAAESSRLERRADEVEREVEKQKKTEYMSEHLGEQFTGIISGVTNWGLYVELPNTIEGLVPIASISDDYYHYSEETFELIGERKNRHFKLGQTVKVIAEDCNLSARTIDFKLAEEKS
jgi:ribonuclease R